MQVSTRWYVCIATLVKHSIIARQFVLYFVTYPRHSIWYGTVVFINIFLSACMVGPLLCWFSSYLSDRKQRDALVISSSAITFIYASVRHGSSSIQFSFINDISHDIQSNIQICADDTRHYVIVEDVVVSADIFKHDLSIIIKWSKALLVFFNPSKSGYAIFSCTRNKPIHPQLHIDCNPISQVSTHTDLGLALSEDTNSKHHIHVWQHMYVIRSHKYFLTRSSLELNTCTSIACIRPLLEYADGVWENNTNYINTDVKSVQREAARISTGTIEYCKTDILLTELNGDTFANRRHKHRPVLLYKMIKGLGLY